MEISKTPKTLDGLIEFYKKQDEQNTQNIAGMYAVKKIMSCPKKDQFNYLGDFALDFHNYQEKFHSEIEKYEKYFDMVPMRKNIEDKMKYIKETQKGSNIAKKLISLRVLDDMKRLEEDIEEEYFPTIYDLALDEYLSFDIEPQTALRMAITDLLRGDQSYAYSVLHDTFLDALSLKDKIKKRDYDSFYSVGEKLIPGFSNLSETEKKKEMESMVDFDFLEDGLTLISEKITQESIKIDPLLEKINEYFNFSDFFEDEGYF